MTEKEQAGSASRPDPLVPSDASVNGSEPGSKYRLDADQATAHVDILEWQGKFFVQVFGSAEGSRLCIARKNATGLHEKFFAYPTELDDALTFIDESAKYDVYFCAQLLTEKRRTKETVAEKLTALWADLDTCQPDSLKVAPSIVVESSPGRWQAIWRLDEPIDKFEAEKLSHRIALYHKGDGCDQSGWDLTQLLRVPFTRNYKYDPAPMVEVGNVRAGYYRVADFHDYRDVPTSTESNGDQAPNGDGGPLPDFEPLPRRSKATEYFWTFFQQVRNEAPQKGARGPNGEDRSRSGRTHWFEQRCAEIELKPGQIRTAVHDYLPAKDKESEEPGWIDHDFGYWLRDEWPKFKDAKFNRDVEERAYTLRVNEAAKAIVTDEQEAATFDPPTTLALTLTEDLTDGRTDDRPFTT